MTDGGVRIVSVIGCDNWLHSLYEVCVSTMQLGGVWYLILDLI